MKVLQMLRKGIGYILMSMGVSSPDALKKKPGAEAVSKTAPRG